MRLIRLTESTATNIKCIFYEKQGANKMKKIIAAAVSISVLCACIPTTHMKVNVISQDGAPINGANVIVDGEYFGTTPNASGSVSNTGSKTIEVTKQGYFPVTTITATEMKTGNLVFALLLNIFALIWITGPKPLQTVTMLPSTDNISNNQNAFQPNTQINANRAVTANELLGLEINNNTNNNINNNIENTIFGTWSRTNKISTNINPGYNGDESGTKTVVTFNENFNFTQFVYSLPDMKLKGAMKGKYFYDKKTITITDIEKYDKISERFNNVDGEIVMKYDLSGNKLYLGPASAGSEVKPFTREK